MRASLPQFTLKTRSIVGLACVVLALGSLNLVTFVILRGYMRDLSGMIDVTTIANDIVVVSGKITEGLPADIEAYSLYPTTEMQAKIHDSFSRIEDDLGKLEKLVVGDEVRIQVFLVHNMFGSIEEKFAEIEKRVALGSAFTEINGRVTDIKDSVPLINDGVQILISKELTYDQAVKSSQARHANGAGYLILLGISLTSMLSFLLYYRFLIERGILHPLAYLQSTMDKIANNAIDIRLRINISRSDEIGQLGEYFNKMADTIQKYKEGLEELVDQRTRQLDDAKVLLVQSGKLSALGEMAGGVAHEVNTPLAIIQMSAEQLLELCEEDTIDRHHIVELTTNIRSTVNRIAKIIKGLRLYSRDASNDPCQKASVKILVEDTLSLCGEKFKLNGVELRISDIASDLMLDCRATQISQVLLNLLGNAFDAVVGKKSPWIELRVQEFADRIEISVTDSGPGIPEAIRAKIFQPFFTTKEVGKGTGLGLSISSGLVTGHGGKFWVDESCANTRFVISLPLMAGILAAA